MPQKRGEVVEKVDRSAPLMPDIYENWIKKQVKATEEDDEEDEIDKAEDVHEKAHRRKRGRGAPSK
jgi:hypothetical protein